MESDFEPHFVEWPVQLEDRLLRPLIKMRASSPGKLLRWWTVLTEMRKQAIELAVPRAVFKLFSLKSLGGRFFINGDRALGITTPSRLQGAEMIGLFGLTLGDKLEKRSTELFSAGQYAEGYLLNVLGTYALTELQSGARAMAAGTGESAMLTAGPGFQPGSRSWIIEDQLLFFDLLPMENLGVSLLDSFATAPAKSKTFACGFWRKR